MIKQKKVTGGRNGYGAKLTNIYSTMLLKLQGKIFQMTWKNNMSTKSEPKIWENEYGDEYTKITFKPDLKLFKMD